MCCMHVQYVSFMYDHEALLPIRLKQCHKSMTLGSYTNFSNGYYLYFGACMQDCSQSLSGLV